MKVRTLIIVLAVAVAVYFTFKLITPANVESQLVGNWKLDSVKTGADSNLMYFMLLSSMQKDSSEIDFLFTKDSLFTFAGDETDTNTYRFNEKKKEITIDGDDKEIYQFNKLNDTTITLTAKDSTSLYLVKARTQK
jgi:hypothetical protein